MKQALLGLPYGCSLTALSFLAAGAGHGTYTLWALASSPAGLLGIPAVFLAPFLWAFVGWLLSAIDKRKTLFLVVMLLHYAGAIYLLTVSDYADWGLARRMWDGGRLLILTGFCWYAAGQVLIWYTLLKSMTRPSSPYQISS